MSKSESTEEKKTIKLFTTFLCKRRSKPMSQHHHEQHSVTFDQLCLSYLSSSVVTSIRNTLINHFPQNIYPIYDWSYSNRNRKIKTYFKHNENLYVTSNDTFWFERSIYLQIDDREHKSSYLSIKILCNWSIYPIV